MRTLGPLWAQAPWVHRVQFPTLPLEPLQWGRRVNRRLRQHDLARLDAFVTEDTWLVFGKPCDLALELCGRYPRATTVFDVMDNMPAFSAGLAGRWMQTAERDLVEQCNWMLASSSALLERHASQRIKTRLAMNGLSTPPPLRRANEPRVARPVVGYVGVIASWFDWDAVIRLARLAPHCEFHLIGPCEGNVPSALPDNVRLMPPISQDAVYATMQSFDAGLIPFKVNNLTDFVDPVKFYEYRALGLPVLTTRFGEMRLRCAENGVFFVEDIRSDDALRLALQSATSAEELLAFRAAHHWDQRFDSVDFFDL